MFIDAKTFFFDNPATVISGCLTIFFLVWFILAFRRNRYRFRTGLLFVLLVLSILILLINLDMFGDFSLTFAVVMFIVIFSAALVITFFLFLLFLLYNGIVLLRKEGISFQNLLSLFLLFYLVLTPVFITNADIIERLPVLKYLVILNGFITMYLFFVAFIYVVAGILVSLTSQRRPVDYIIVLGCGLNKNGIVTPLLAGRIDRAIRLFQKAPERTILLMSGGQGSDEPVAEGVAMKEYAMEQGIPEDHILVEDKSRNTEENMRFSRALIKSRTTEPVKIAFATNSYHQFRAGVYAAMAGMNIRGVGSRTRVYFAQNAMIREFIALIHHNQKMHIICGIVFALILLILM